MRSIQAAMLVSRLDCRSLLAVTRCNGCGDGHVGRGAENLRENSLVLLMNARENLGALFTTLRSRRTGRRSGKTSAFAQGS